MRTETARTDLLSPLVRQDPARFELRARPPRVERFRPAMVISISSVIAGLLAAIMWTSLGPRAADGAARRDDASEEKRPVLPDAFGAGPTSYAEVPRLGRPLPGDLGRPILAQERAERAATESSGARESVAPRPAEGPTEGQVRESAIMMALASNGKTRGETLSNGTNTAPQGALRPRLVSERVSREIISDPLGSISSRSGLLAPGSVIAASLVTGLNSDLPGVVVAQVTEHVRDTATGQLILIPQGARLVGRSERVSGVAQYRAMVAWQRIVLPDGTAIEVEDLTASDTTGQIGLADAVDRHVGPLLEGVALSSLLGIGTELGMSNEGDITRAVREAVQQETARAGDQLVARNLEIAPTITVRPGWPLRVIVTRELVLQPWRTYGQ